MLQGTSPGKAPLLPQQWLLPAWPRPFMPGPWIMAMALTSEPSGLPQHSRCECTQRPARQRGRGPLGRSPCPCLGLAVCVTCRWPSSLSLGEASPKRSLCQKLLTVTSRRTSLLLSLPWTPESHACPAPQHYGDFDLCPPALTCIFFCLHSPWGNLGRTGPTPPQLLPDLQPLLDFCDWLAPALRAASSPSRSNHRGLV